MTAYRDGYGPLEHRRAEVAETAARVDARSDALNRVIASRIGRLVGGSVGIVGVLLLAPVWWAASPSGDSPLPTWWFLGSAAAAVASGVLTTRALRGVRWIEGRFGVRARERAARDAALRKATDPSSLDAQDPWTPIARALRRLETASLAVPLVAASLLLPLLTHAAVWFPAALLDGRRNIAEGFANWILISGMLVGHAHVALAICAALFAKKLGRLATIDITALRLGGAVWRALWISVLVSAIPGILLLAVPPVLSTLTALVVIPLMFVVAKRVLVRERAVVDEAQASIAEVRVGIEEIQAAEERLRIGVEETPVHREHDEVGDLDVDVVPEARGARRTR